MVSTRFVLGVPTLGVYTEERIRSTLRPQSIPERSTAIMAVTEDDDRKRYHLLLQLGLDLKSSLIHQEDIQTKGLSW